MIFVSFVIGVMVGICTLLIGLVIWSNSFRKEDAAKVEEALRELELVASVKQRFARVSELTERQLQLIAQTERPSASAAHSRHKNTIAGELKEMEREKMDIFRSILKDGMDPQLTIIIDGKTQNIKMSEALAYYESEYKTQIPSLKTDSKPAQVKKLHLVKDKSNEPSDPKVPRA